MSLGIAFKGPEGIVLAVDSRVTLNIPTSFGTQTFMVPATYDNATKLLRVGENQTHVGAITYGIGAIGTTTPRTAHSYLPELEAGFRGVGRLSVEAFANWLSGFFLWQWYASGMPAPANWPQDQNMIFVVGGYDEGGAYGRIFEFYIPHMPTPREQSATDFGMVWGGQREFVDRLMVGFDDSLPVLTQQHLSLSDAQRESLKAHLRANLGAKIPFAFLPLQDCVDLAIFLIRTTISAQSSYTGIRGVGGAIDAATITRTKGFSAIQSKVISGEKGERTAYVALDNIAR